MKLFVRSDSSRIGGITVCPTDDVEERPDDADDDLIKDVSLTETALERPSTEEDANANGDEVG